MIIDGLVTIQIEKNAAGDGVHKFTIKESGVVFYDQNDNIAEAYHDHCLMQRETCIGNARIQRCGWVVNRGGGLPGLYVYYIHEGGVTFADRSKNIHTAYVNFISRTNRAAALLDRLCAFLCIK